MSMTMSIEVEDEDEAMKAAIKRSILAANLSNEPGARKKAKQRGASADAIIILSDDEDGDSSNMFDGTDDDDDDDDVVIVDNSTAATSARTIEQTDDNDDDEVQAIGENNVMRLPHARQHCTQGQFVQDVSKRGSLALLCFPILNMRVEIILIKTIIALMHSAFPLTFAFRSFFYTDSYKSSQYVECLG